MLGGIQACNKNIATNEKSVQEIDIVNPGYGYTMNPGIAVTAVASGPGSGFAGTAYVADGTLGVVTVTNAGGGFLVIEYMLPLIHLYPLLVLVQLLLVLLL